MPANGLAFAVPHPRHRSVSSNEAARPHPFISGIVALGSRRFRPHPAAVEPRFEGVEFGASTRWAVPVPSRVENRVAVELHAERRGAQIDAERFSFDIHPDFPSRAKAFLPRFLPAQRQMVEERRCKKPNAHRCGVCEPIPHSPPQAPAGCQRFEEDGWAKGVPG